MHTVRFIRQVYSRYAKNNGGLTAAAISYYGLVSLIPLLLLSISLFGYVLGAQKGYDAQAAYEHTASMIQKMVPWNQQDINLALHEISGQAGSTGIIGLVALLWIGSQFFHVLEVALNRTWCASTTRPFWKGRLMALWLMALCGILLLLSLFLGVTAQWVESQRIPWSREQLSHLPFVWTILMSYLVPMAFSAIAFALIYQLVPSCRVHWKEAIVGGIFAGVAWEIARVGFGYYISSYGTRGYTHIYGSLTGLAILIVWTYYTANILVIGGEFARVWVEWNCARDKSGPPRNSRTHRAGRPETASSNGRPSGGNAKEGTSPRKRRRGRKG